MNEIRALVFSLFKETDNIIVFPSEDSARYFLMEYVKSEKKAIKAERAIAFDTFRSLFLPIHEDEQPTNNYHRALFTSALDIKALNLSYLSGSKYPESQARLRPFIEKCLPLLKDRDNFKSELKADLDKLYNEYVTFLRANKLFETGYETLEKVELDNNYTVLFPELTAGSDEVVDFLCGEDKVKFIYVKDLDCRAEIPLTQYPNIRLEIKGMMRKLVELKNSGVRLGDITISTPDLEAVKPLLNAEARLYSIPLSFNIGRAILQTVPGSLLLKLQQVYMSAFSFSSLEELLLSHSFPWRDLSFNREFILTLARKGAKGGSVEYKADAIYRSLSRYNTEDLKAPLFLEFYKNLKSTIISLFSSRSMETVQLTLHTFMSKFFIEEQFYDGGDREAEYSFLLNEMNNFARVQKGLKIEVDATLNLLITSLKNKLYVSQNKTEGIKVYNFGQDVLIDTPYHFVINLSDDMTKTVGQKAVFFEPYEVVIEEKQKNVAEEYFILYQMGSEHLTFSYAVDTYSGVVIPSEYFMIKGNIKEADYSTDSYKEALKVIKGENTSSFSLPLLKESFENGETTSLSKTAYLDDWANLEARGKKVSDLKFSFSSLNEYATCPFSYFVDHLLGLKDEKFYPDDIDHALVGEKLHSVIETFFRKYPTLNGTKLEEYKNYASSIFEEMLQKWEKESKAPDLYTRYWMKEKYLPLIYKLIENTIEDFPSSSTLALEAVIKGEAEEMSFYGRIDRVVDNADGTVSLIDYKKGSAKDKKDSLQLPLYKLFYEEQNNKKVSSISYYGFSDNKKVEVKDVDEKIDMAKEAIKAMKEGVSQGKWNANVTQEGCKNCVYRSICRRRFSIV